jgi:tyrosyl-tRNA synthetase
VLFEKAEPAMLSATAWEDLLRSVPNLKLAALSDAPALAALLVAVGLEVSNSRALDSIRAGGVSINNVKVSDSRLVLSEAHLLQGRYALIRKGKKHFAIVAVG